MVKNRITSKRFVLSGLVIIAWLALAGVGGMYFAKMSDLSSTDLSTFVPKNAESTKVNDIINKFYSKKTIPVFIVYSNNGKDLTDSEVSAVDNASDRLSNINGIVGKISPPVKSDDNKAVFVAIPLASNGDFKSIFSAIKLKLAGSHLPISYLLTGPGSFAYDLQNAFSGIDGTLLFVALGVVFIILLFVYRSLLLPFIVLFTSMCALSGAVIVVYYLAKANIVLLNGQVQGILFILVIGATTDYSLLYIARYREELANYQHAWQASWAALRSSSVPIIAAGGTVTAGLLCLLFSDLGANQALGPVGGTGMIFSITATLTLLPVILLPFGRLAFWPREPKYVPTKGRHDYQQNHPVWKKVGALIKRHPRKIWMGATAVLLIACIGIFQLKADGVRQSDFVIGKSEARDGQQVIEAHFVNGFGSPALIAVRRDHQDAVIRVVEANKGVASVNATATGSDSGAMPVGKSLDDLNAKIQQQATAEWNLQLQTFKAQTAKLPKAAVAAVIAKMPSIESITDQINPFKDAKEKVVNGTVLLQATLSDSADSFAARGTIVQLRDSVKKVDSSALIGGTSAGQYDTNEGALRDEKIIIPLILIAITIILMLLLRAIVAPLLLLLTTVMSFGATLGVSALLFNGLWHFPGTDPSVVIFGFVFLVALGIDYNIFLMTRVREETKKSGVVNGTIKGLVVTGGVITSAGVILAATFASLSVIPILFLSEIAFIVAFGVLLDTIVVRSLLAPALTLEVGRKMWWPSKLSR